MFGVDTKQFNTRFRYCYSCWLRQISENERTEKVQMCSIVTSAGLFPEYPFALVYYLDIVAESREINTFRFCQMTLSGTYEMRDIDRIGQTFGLEIIEC